MAPKKKWLVHSYRNPPAFVTHTRAKKLMAKYGGDFHWMEDVCHVYLLPITTANFTARGQEELNVFRLLEKNGL